MESERLLKEFLAESGILYEEIEHPPLFSCDDWERLGLPKLTGVDTKNLFLEDEKGSLYLLTTECRKRVRINDLRKSLGLKKLSFGKEEDMIRTLGVTPGAVTSFGLLFDQNKEVSFLLDTDVSKADYVQLHPCRNDKTIIMKKEDYMRFFSILGIPSRFVTIL
mgnify:CR=1 FL=1